MSRGVETGELLHIHPETKTPETTYGAMLQALFNAGVELPPGTFSQTIGGKLGSKIDRDFRKGSERRNSFYTKPVIKESVG